MSVFSDELPPHVDEILALRKNDENPHDSCVSKNTQRLIRELSKQGDGFLKKVYSFMIDKKCRPGCSMFFSLHLHHTDYNEKMIINWFYSAFNRISSQGFHVRFTTIPHINRCEAVLTDIDVNPINHHSMHFELQITCEQPPNDGRHYYIV